MTGGSRPVGGRTRGLALAALLSSLAAPPAFAEGIAPELLPVPGLIAGLREAGLIGAGEPVARFAWTLEVKRPMRDPKVVSERYLGSPGGGFAGLSPMIRTYAPQPAAPDAGVRPVLSVRGLTTLRPEETALEVAVQDLRLPLAQGARFRLDWHDDGAKLEQACTVIGQEPAATLNPALPGPARRIECEGKGSYKGIPVGVSATVFYLERLGVFVQAENTIRTPLGALRSWTRITGFSMP